MPVDQLRAWVRSAHLVMAADGGADRLLECGSIPAATIGDLDSISAQAAERQFELIGSEDQDSTDCDKLLALAATRGHRRITLAGVEGDLPDHVLGTFQSAARATIAVRFAFRKGVGEIVRGPAVRTYELAAGSRYSLVPLVPCYGVTLRGTRWELDEAALEPMGLTSLSNRVERSPVSLVLESGVAFLFVETDGTPVWT